MEFESGEIEAKYDDFVREYFHNPAYGHYLAGCRLRLDQTNPEIEVALKEELPEELKLPKDYFGLKVTIVPPEFF